jgi:hypothetical protein
MPISRAGGKADPRAIYQALTKADRGALGGLISQSRRHERWDITEAAVRDWAQQEGLT